MAINHDVIPRLCPLCLPITEASGVDHFAASAPAEDQGAAGQVRVQPGAAAAGDGKAVPVSEVDGCSDSYSYRYRYSESDGGSDRPGAAAAVPVRQSGQRLVDWQRARALH